MKIGIDIDGVILDFERTMNTYAEIYDLLILNKKGKINNKFSYLDKYDWTVNERKEFIDNYLVYATLNSTPLMISFMLSFLVAADCAATVKPVVQTISSNIAHI